MKSALIAVAVGLVALFVLVGLFKIALKLAGIALVLGLAAGAFLAARRLLEKR